MTLIKHNKIKNTGIIFEVLTRQLTSDTLSGNDSKALGILKKYFVNTELGKEYKLYESLFKEKNITETKANMIMEAVLQSSKNINKSKLKKEKYNIIKELKENYDLDTLFRIKLSNYKKYAALSNLLEINNNQDNSFNLSSIIENKNTILESLTNVIQSQDKKEDIINEFKVYDKDTRLLTCKILMENFNSKYNVLSKDQKRILKEYINSVDSTSQLRDFYNKEIISLKQSITEQSSKTSNPVTKIKLEEITKIMNVIDKNNNIKTDNLVDLLQYHSLINELKSVHGKI